MSQVQLGLNTCQTNVIRNKSAIATSRDTVILPPIRASLLFASLYKILSWTAFVTECLYETLVVSFYIALLDKLGFIFSLVFHLFHTCSHRNKLFPRNHFAVEFNESRAWNSGYGDITCYITEYSLHDSSFAFISHPSSHSIIHAQSLRFPCPGFWGLFQK
jgi:hypothetical protein